MLSELTIAGLLGHSVPGVTARNAHVPDRALVAAADQISKRIGAALAGDRGADAIEQEPDPKAFVAWALAVTAFKPIAAVLIASRFQILLRSSSSVPALLNASIFDASSREPGRLCPAQRLTSSQPYQANGGRKCDSCSPEQHLVALLPIHRHTLDVL